MSFCGRPFIPVKADRRPLTSREMLCCEEGNQRYINCDGEGEEVDADTVCNETDSK